MNRKDQDRLIRETLGGKVAKPKRWWLRLWHWICEAKHE